MAKAMHALLQSKLALLADVEGGPPGRLLVRSDLSGTMQLYELGPDRELTPLTALPEPVGRAQYLRSGEERGGDGPGGDGVVFEVDRGGDERYQLYLLARDATEGGPVTRLGDLSDLTKDPEHVHQLAGVSPDGTQVAYLSNRANGIDFDLWVVEIATGTERRVYAADGWCEPGSGFSPDGRWISVLRAGPRPLDNDLLLVGVGTGEVRTILPHPEEAALVDAPAWLGDDELLVSSNIGRDNSIVLRHNLSTGLTEPLSRTGEPRTGEPRTGERWDTHVFSGRRDGTACFVENRNGASHVAIRAAGDPEETEVPLPEAGVVTNCQFSADGLWLYCTLTTPRRPEGVWAFHRG
ncbi:MAG TPA: hypothetical protein VEJ84_20685, partial [Acidimicrobiales bacterium]|nr:hypothetical protein [Acidimicrobiales bacterium]